ncbi:rCG37963, isoform CRA_a [Rattus norvegicus]|uniref:RCG37963, isoform CRA_a n=1 Tax=Rattus norvegicus TaxID=10116 RepID=A6K5Q1_RAT|nr:rCG37963, isoform CRA_a [Rattus norvegicus]
MHMNIANRREPNTSKHVRRGASTPKSCSTVPYGNTEADGGGGGCI